VSETAEQYRKELQGLKDWEPYLRKHSGLPGPRANLELVAAVAEEADADRLWRLSASADEFLALCGTAGLGKVALMEPDTVMSWLRELASDPRWRVREGVAMALQRIGRESMPRLIAEMTVWSQGDPYVQRAAAAGLCEPANLKRQEDAVEVMAILDHITHALSVADDRRQDAYKVLRQALGYCWSVAAAAAPQNARPYLEKWLRSTDKDVAWVMNSNLSKARMNGLEDLEAAPAPRRKTIPSPKPQPAAKRPAPAKAKSTASKTKRRPAAVKKAKR
jgi:hypothetical protein